MTDTDKTSAGPALSRRKLLIGLGMIGAASVAQARLPEPNRPRVPNDKLDAMIPKTVGEWTYATESGLVLPPQDALSDRLYDNLVTRIYTNPARQSLMMLVAYNNRQDGVIQLHRPEICYPAGGFTLSPTRAVDISLGNGNVVPSQAFLATGPQRDESVLYWTRVGSDFPRKWAEQRLAVATANLGGIIPDGLLVRISTLGNDLNTELPIMQGFIAALARAGSPAMDKLFFDSLASARAV